ncbi:MAG: hypothetical protein HZC49_01500 [Nitrospirae bacterium]|nr:hypothetical protein [Nitrospirota bacterium]
MAEVKVQKITYAGWSNCLQITNSVVDLIVTTDVGPRIIRYGFLGHDNEMCEIKSTMGLSGGDEWRIYGGHRLWHSPEDRIRTYSPDNTAVTILHRLTNTNRSPVELSAWSISAMAPGGKEVVPQTHKDTGLLPNRVMSLWPYSRLNDSRVYFGGKYIILRQDPQIMQPFKFGISNEQGWAVYFNRDHLFVKYYRHDPKAVYPDFGVSYETYTNDSMLEMETLSPLTRLGPFASIEHEEKWELFDNVQMPDDEVELERVLTGIINIAT